MHNYTKEIVCVCSCQTELMTNKIQSEQSPFFTRTEWSRRFGTLSETQEIPIMIMIVKW